MKVYQRLASAFKTEGVSHIFGLMGDAANVVPLPNRRLHYGLDE